MAARSFCSHIFPTRFSICINTSLPSKVLKPTRKKEQKFNFSKAVGSNSLGIQSPVRGIFLEPKLEVLRSVEETWVRQPEEQCATPVTGHVPYLTCAGHSAHRNAWKDSQCKWCLRTVSALESSANLIFLPYSLSFSCTKSHIEHGQSPKHISHDGTSAWIGFLYCQP